MAQKLVSLFHGIALFNFLFGIYYDLNYLHLPEPFKEIVENTGAFLKGRTAFLTFWNMAPSPTKRDPTTLKMGEIFRTECGKFSFVCTYCDSPWGTYRGIKKHINSHFNTTEQSVEMSEHPLVSSEFVSIGEFKPKTEVEMAFTLTGKDIVEDRRISLIGPSAAEMPIGENKIQSADKSESASPTKFVKAEQRKSINEPIASERINKEDKTHSENKSESPPTTKIVKIVKLKRIKLNPRPNAMKKKSLDILDQKSDLNMPANFKNMEKPPETIQKSGSHPQPDDSVHLQSCYQCEMEPKIHKPSDPRRHICLFCPIWFSNHVWFELHITNIHKKDPDYLMCEEFYCYICEKSFSSRQNLTSHLDTHKEPEIFLCDICGSTHKTKGRLVEHIKIHDGPKIECDQCGKTFHRFSALRQHFWLHDDPSFACTVCSKAFKMKRYLDRHMAVHDEPKIPCRHCDAKFHFVTVRRSHERSRHHIM